MVQIKETPKRKRKTPKTGEPVSETKKKMSKNAVDAKGENNTLILPTELPTKRSSKPKSETKKVEKPARKVKSVPKPAKDETTTPIMAALSEQFKNEEPVKNESSFIHPYEVGDSVKIQVVRTEEEDPEDHYYTKTYAGKTGKILEVHDNKKLYYVLEVNKEQIFCYHDELALAEES